jgi:hypothetical protein
MKKVALFGFVVVLMTSCTLEDQGIEESNSIRKNEQIQQGAPEVDPGKVKPPTHG